MKTKLLVGLVLACAILAVPDCGIAKPASLTPAQMRIFGETALLKGYAGQALEIATALLKRDPQDASALVIQAQALRMLGQLPQSEASARAAWKAAEQSSTLRYAAATAVAQSLALQDKRARAQLWLRRAADVAPNAAMRNQAMEDFEFVRQQNPLNLRLNFLFRPSDNVNGGARDSSFVFRGIPFVLSGDALALSGANWGAGLTGRYRLSASPVGETALTFDLNHQGVVLSDKARQQAPTAKNGNYTLDHAEIGFEKLIGADPAPGLAGQWRVATTVGKTIYGGKPLSNDYGASLGFDRRFKKLSLSFEASLNTHDRQDNNISSSFDRAVGGNLSFRSKSGDLWRFSVTYQDVASNNINIDHTETNLTLGWQAAKPLAGIGIGATIGLKTADFGASPYTANGRQDRAIRAGFTAELTNLDYMGFMPVFGVDYSRSNSNLALYDTSALGVNFSIKSQF